MKSAAAFPRPPGATGTARKPGMRWTTRLLVMSGVALLVAGIAWLGLRWVPLPASLMEAGATPPGRLEVTDRHGTSLRVLAGPDGLIRRPTPEAAIPPWVKSATLAAEDARFEQHPGVDLRAILRAAWQWARNGRIISGGSTITQQLLKLAQPVPRRRTLLTKAREALEAFRLEQIWDKDRILAAYLDHLNYGNRCRGLTEAARQYFHKSPQDLTLAEAALLAGLPQAPARLNPRLQPERARRRQHWILRRCRELGWITEAELARALQEEVKLSPPWREFRAPHFVDFILEQEASDTPGNPELRTTLDLPLQQAAEAALAARLAPLRSQRAGQGAVVILDNRSGELLALVGSADWSAPEDGQVNGALARRSPGSALKPFTYLLALQDGARPGDILPDLPCEFPTPTGTYRPENYDRRFHGPVSLRVALASSLNIPAVRLLHRLGGPAVLQSTLQDFGLTTLDQAPDHYGLGLTLGNPGVTLLELANAYATLARLGEWRPVRWRANAPAAPARRVAEAGACWLIADILRDPAARVTGFGLESPLALPFPAACKTGTSSDFRDNWAFGFTPEFTVAVWVGNFDGQPMNHVSGITGAAPVLQDLLVHLHDRMGTSWYPDPPGLKRVQVHPATGRARPDANRQPAVEEPVLPETSYPPEEPGDYDASGRVILPPEYRLWLESPGNPQAGEFAGATAGENPAAPLRILSPAEGLVLAYDPDLPAGSQCLSLRASHPCEWRSRTLRLSGEGRRMEAQLEPGRHQLEARDPRTGQWVTTWVEVRPL